MHWINEVDKINEFFEANFAKLNAEELNWKPNVHTWSIAQNLEHIIIVNQSYFPVFDAYKAGTYQTPWIAKVSFLVSFFEKTVLKAVQPDRQKKMKTFRTWKPSQTKISEDILEKFREHQGELKRLITDSKDLVGKSNIIGSPANKNIVYSIETAFDIIVTHEQRHINQAKEIYNLIKR